MNEQITFVEELRYLINRYSKENGSNTPDFILAEYLSECLDIFNKTVKRREKWYGKEDKIKLTPAEIVENNITL